MPPPDAGRRPAARARPIARRRRPSARSRALGEWMTPSAVLVTDRAARVPRLPRPQPQRVRAHRRRLRQRHRAVPAVRRRGRAAAPPRICARRSSTSPRSARSWPNSTARATRARRWRASCRRCAPSGATCGARASSSSIRRRSRCRRSASSKVPAHLSVDEMTRLLEMPDDGEPLGRRDRAILELFYASGLRLSELVQLDLEDVNLSARIVRVMGKGRKERLVPFNTSTKTALAAWLKDRAALREAALAGDSARRGSRRSAEVAPRAAVRQLPRHAADRPQRAAAGRALRGRLQHALRHQPARAAALVCHAPARARRRPARHPGAARPRAALHHAALHPRERGAAARVYRKAHPARAWRRQSAEACGHAGG